MISKLQHNNIFYLIIIDYINIDEIKIKKDAALIIEGGLVKKSEVINIKSREYEPRLRAKSEIDLSVLPPQRPEPKFFKTLKTLLNKENAKWVCKNCTLENVAHRRTCTVCLLPKNDYDSDLEIENENDNLFFKNKEWTCLSCTFLNIKNKNCCQACDKSRFENINGKQDYDEESPRIREMGNKWLRAKPMRQNSRSLADIPSVIKNSLDE